MEKNKIIFFGSFEFAVQTIEKLAALENYEIVAVVTNPDKPVGRKKVLAQSPVKTRVLSLGIRVLQPEKLKDNQQFFDELKNLNADLGIVVGYSKILPPEMLHIPRLGMLNIHPSLLPKYRGPSPVVTAILNGEKETGVTIIRVDAEMDHGPILGQKTLELKPTDTAVSLHGELFKLGTDLLLDILPDYISGRLKPIPQNDSQATFSKMLKTEDGEIKPTDTVTLAYNKVRALNPEPGSFTIINGQRLKILEADCSVDPTKPHIKLADGMLGLITVQPEGRRAMTGADWLRGQKNK